MKRFLSPMFVAGITAGLLIAGAVSLWLGGKDRAVAADGSADLTELRATVKNLQGRVPNQAAAMHLLGSHFSNLWFALDKENYKLAGFYAGQVQKNLQWAARIHPTRKDKSGKTVEFAAIAQGFENAQLKEFHAALAAGDKAKSVKLYHDAVGVCNACHTACDFPAIRVKVPTEPETRIIDFTPAAP